MKKYLSILDGGGGGGSHFIIVEVMGKCYTPPFMTAFESTKLFPFLVETICRVLHIKNRY